MKQLFKKLIVFIMVVSILSVTSLSYVSAATDPYLLGYKWNKSTVSIYIDDTPYTKTIPSIYYTSWRFDILQALDRWSMYLEHVFDTNFNFIMASTKSSADIVIEYGVSTSWAETINTRSGTTLIKSKIIVDDWDLFNNSFDTYTVTKILVHEIGHAIGLAQISVFEAQLNGIYSVMVESISSTYFTDYPSLFDGINVEKMY